MTTAEANLLIDPEEFLNEVVEWRPPSVVGRPDVSEVLARAEGRPATEPGYAWFRLPSWLAQVLNVYDNIGYKPIIGVDVCSSTPVYAQILRAHEFSRHGARARELVKTMFSTEPMAQLKSLGLAPLAYSLSRDKPGRNLLEAAIQDVLFTIVQSETVQNAHGTNEKLEDRFTQKLLRQSVIYEESRSGGNMSFRAKEVLGPDGRPLNYVRALGNIAMPSQDQAVTEAKQRLAAGTGTKEDYAIAQLTDTPGIGDLLRFMEWQPAFLARHVAGNRRFRPARFFSMDVADPDDIVASSLAHTPQTTQETDIFMHALSSLYEPKQHIRGNVFEPLPLPDESVALITCFDGFPAGFQLDPDLHVNHEDFVSVALDVLSGWYRKLSPGGKIVIFPWTIYSDTHSEQKANQRALDAVVIELGRRIHDGVDRKVIPNEVLQEWMSVGDLETMENLSPVLTQKQPATEALIITKPKESSLRSRQRLHGKNLT